MCSVAIRVKNVSKQYRLGVIGRDTLTRDLQSKWARFRGKEDPNSVVGLMSKAQENGSNNSFWALRDITFDVEQGQILGIIGPNGAGKSTLLKIMSRVTTPTEGIIKVKGRIASLLEVGTGFHPELTGRENVYLNGAILGMTKKEIDKKFEEIVAFAEVEKFIDTPVKRYSSGMYVRLAFAVAAHLEPEILIVDEVLAVGDAQFQKKCLGKMEDVSKAGRTVLFVSHNMNAVQNLCNKGILLGDGQIKSIGKTKDVVDTYLAFSNAMTMIPLGVRTDRKGNGALRFTDITFENSKGERLDNPASGEDVRVVLDYKCNDVKPLRNVLVSLEIITNGERFAHLDTYITGQNFETVPLEGQIVCSIPKLPLLPGTYSIVLYSTVNMVEADWIEDAAVFQVKSGYFFKTGAIPADCATRFLIDHSWALSEVSYKHG